MKVLICDYQVTGNHEREKKILQQYVENVEMEVYQYENEEKLAGHLKGVDALLTAFLKIDRKTLQAADKLKVISIDATGYGNVDVDAAKEAGVAVCTLGEYCTDEVADHAMAFILMLEKNIKAYQMKIEKEFCYSYRCIPPRKRIQGQVLAIFGYGRIGRALGKRAMAFGIKVVAVTRRKEQVGETEAGVRFVTSEEALQCADIISNNMSENRENHHYFNREKFEKMKKNPIFINVGRGSSVKEEDLLWALKEGIISGAGLDVLETIEPDLKEDPLASLDQVILTPHSAFYSKESMEFIQKAPVMNLVHFWKGNKEKITNLL